MLPVLFIAYLCCHYDRAELLVGLFLVEWLVLLVVWRRLCPWLGSKSVGLAAVPYLLSFCVAAILARESITECGAVWNWSDDWWYLGQAENVVHSLHSSSWNIWNAWLELASIEYGAWTLLGWPFMLGLISSLVTANPNPEMLHAIALSINATFLSLVLALIYLTLQEPARRFPRTVMVCFLLMIGDPIVYAAMSRKESILQVSLMLVFVFCVKLSERFRTQWLLVGLLGMAVVATTRPAYIPLLLIILYWRLSDRIRLSSAMKVIVGFILVALFSATILGFQIRESTIADRLAGKRLEGESGMAMSVYNIPVVGPPLFYAISPVPPLPWKLLSHSRLATTLIRSAGSVAWFLSLCYVLRGIFRKRSLLKDRLFFIAAIMFTGLFIAAVLSGDDPRYKQATNFYLALMLFMTWYDSRIQRSGFRVYRIGRIEMQRESGVC